MFVIYATPFFTQNTMGLIKAFAHLEGVRLGVISQEPQEVLPLELRQRFVGHWRVHDALNFDQLNWAAAELARRHGPVQRLIAANEQIQLPLAQVRDRLGIPGMSAETVLNFRDKGRMKDLFHEHGIPCARHCRAVSDDDAWSFVQEVGFPICVKPVDGAAAQSTYRVENSRSLRELLQSRPASPQAPLQLEEFLVGQENSFESVTLGGVSVWHSWTRYQPTPLDVMRNPWIQWRIVLPREVDDSDYDEIREFGPRALKALGMGTGLSHLEWFRRSDGRIAIGEVGARPPGAQITTMMDRAHDMNSEEAWARLMVFGDFDAPKERKYAVGNAFLRGLGGSRVKGVMGIDQVFAEIGEHITDYRIPQLGQPAAISYEGEGFIIVRHPETRVVDDLLKYIINTVRVDLV
ncbi:ATP-grasp domain-containing protein [bacterium]|nr:ATP-grasp domain-containing protein [bacterium]